MDEVEKSPFLTREKLLGVHKHKNFKWGMAIIVAFLVLDIAFLNYKILTLNKNTKEEALKVLESEEENVPETSASTSGRIQVCDAECAANLSRQIDSIKSSQGSSSAPSVQSSVKEYYIPLGSGSGFSTTMQNMSGMQAYIDTSAYGSIKQVTFEVSMYVPTGNEIVTVQLYNTTANHPVWNSVVSYTGSAPQLLISNPITLDPGNNLYQVQMQTQLTYPAYISQATVHIITY